MNRFIIYGYMNRIRRDDIIRFANNQSVNLQEYEVDVIYNYIKNNSRKILNNPEKVLEEAKSMVSYDTYQKLLELYDKYKDKISNI